MRDTPVKGRIKLKTQSPHINTYVPFGSAWLFPSLGMPLLFAGAVGIILLLSYRKGECNAYTVGASVFIVLFVGLSAWSWWRRYAPFLATRVAWSSEGLTMSWLRQAPASVPWDRVRRVVPPRARRMPPGKGLVLSHPPWNTGGQLVVELKDPDGLALVPASVDPAFLRLLETVMARVNEVAGSEEDRVFWQQRLAGG